MLRTQAKPGMKVVFGRTGDRAEKSIGKIKKCNPTRAQVELLEERGTFRTYPVGTVFNVGYAIMEPLPDDGDKDAVQIGKPKPEIKVGVTTFRAGYADGNPLWKVVKSVGRDAYLCEIVNEPINIGGKMIPSDFAGTRKAFMGREIAAHVASAKFWDSLEDEAERFYTSLKPNAIVHYDSGFGAYVRCRVVKEGAETKLKPIALVGDWKPHSLPRRMKDGSVYNGYHVDQIIKGETFRPHASNLYEYPTNERKHANPAGMMPVNLNVPDMTEAEAAKADLWKKIDAIGEYCQGGDCEPETIIEAIRKILA